MLELTVNVGRDEPYDLGEGYNHMALVVDDLDALLAGLAEHGVEPEKPPYAPGGETGVPDLFCRRSGRLPDRIDRPGLSHPAGSAAPVEKSLKKSFALGR